jgi:ATP/maltotriose-dependent transcriptional regulator MalT
VYDEESWTGAQQARAFARLADEQTAAGDAAAALATLGLLTMRLWWGNPDDETRALVVAAAERVPVDPDDPRLLNVLAHTDPIGHGRIVLERLSRHEPDAQTDPVTTYILAGAADALFAYHVSLPYLALAVDGFRAQGRVGALAQALVSQAVAAVHLARAPLALAAAEEAARLAEETRQGRWVVAARMVIAIVAAERGDSERAAALTDEAEAVLMPMGANPLLSLVQFARGRGAVAHQHYDEGYAQLRRILDPADVAYQPLLGCWALSDLVESAAHTGRRDEALAYLARLESLAERTTSPFLLAQRAYARPLVAPDDGAEELFQTALQDGVVQWPCYRGRLLLAYGRWLRRQRRVAESRAPLRAARESFDALGFAGLAESARRELRASGETSRQRRPELRDQLTPQELQIAQMAADGLSNRDIGLKLYLSHRTVGSHLYRIFPKLGISSRAQLGAALRSLA